MRIIFHLTALVFATTRSTTLKAAYTTPLNISRKLSSMSANEDIEYIDKSELKARLRDPLLQVVDVRDSDYAGGHIPGAVNHPSNVWDDAYASALASELSTADSTKRELVFHCMKSQVRGPHCARMLLSKLVERQNPNSVKM